MNLSITEVMDAVRQHGTTKTNAEILESFKVDVSINGDQRVKDLTKRERQVLDCAVKGLTVSATAKTIFLSIKTVSTYKARIKEKMNLKDESEWRKFLIELATQR